MSEASSKRQILTIARQAVRAALAQKPYHPPDELDEALRQRRGCFVTLHSTTGQLRGCIGTFEADRPLVQAIIEMAGAATRDPRFMSDPVTLDELDRLVIEVSVLTPRQPLADPLALRVGVDGIYVHDPRTGRSGCFLPQVALEQNWDAAQTLSYCCSHKMGLAHDAWREPTDLKFFTFQASVYSETAPGRIDP